MKKSNRVMSRNKINKNIKPQDHPETHFDVIGNYKGDDREIPTSLKRLLEEQCGHRCTICRAPYIDLHHIKHYANKGDTNYENLIALCPNCHRRVHKEGVPSDIELGHYKKRLEVSHGMPIPSRLSVESKKLLKGWIKNREKTPFVLQLIRKYSPEIIADTEVEAIQKFRVELGYLDLEKEGIIQTNTPLIFMNPESTWGVKIELKLSITGIRWLDSLIETKRTELLD